MCYIDEEFYEPPVQEEYNPTYDEWQRDMQTVMGTTLSGSIFLFRFAWTHSDVVCFGIGMIFVILGIFAIYRYITATPWPDPPINSIAADT